MRNKLYDPGSIRVGAGNGSCIGLAPGCILGKIAAGNQIPGVSGAGDGTGAVIAQTKITKQHNLFGHLLFYHKRQIGNKQRYDGVNNGTSGNKVVEHHGASPVVEIALTAVAAITQDVEWTGPDLAAFVSTCGRAQLYTIVAVKIRSGWCPEPYEAAYHSVSKHCGRRRSNIDGLTGRITEEARGLVGLCGALIPGGVKCCSVGHTKHVERAIGRQRHWLTAHHCGDTDLIVGCVNAEHIVGETGYEATGHSCRKCDGLTHIGIFKE